MKVVKLLVIVCLVAAVSATGVNRRLRFRLKSQLQAQTQAGPKSFGKLYLVVSNAFDNKLDAWDDSVLTKLEGYLGLSTAITQHSKYTEGKALYATPKAFMDKIKGCAMDNPILVAFGAAVDAKLSSESFIPAKGEWKAAVKEALHYAYYLNSLAYAVGKDDVKADTFFKKLDDEMATLRGKPWFGKMQKNAFEKAKVISIQIPVVNMVKMAQGTEQINPDYGGWGLSINILEAMLQDYALNHVKNALAGLELMRRPTGVPPYIAQIQAKEATLENGVMKLYPPFPKEWADLYSSWNMAFVSNYPDVHMFMGKLVNPMTFCYHGENRDPEYLYYRIVTLYIHIHMVMARRNAGLDKDIDFRNFKLTEEWGNVNLEWGGTYKAKVDAGLVSAGKDANFGKKFFVKTFEGMFSALKTPFKWTVPDSDRVAATETLTQEQQDAKLKWLADQLKATQFAASKMKSLDGLDLAGVAPHKAERPTLKRSMSTGDMSQAKGEIASRPQQKPQQPQPQQKSLFRKFLDFLPFGPK